MIPLSRSSKCAFYTSCFDYFVSTCFCNLYCPMLCSFMTSGRGLGLAQPFKDNFDQLQLCASDTVYSPAIREICSQLSKSPGARAERVYFLDRPACLDIIKSFSKSDDHKLHLSLFKQLLEKIKSDDGLSKVLSVLVMQGPNLINHDEVSVTDAVITAKLQSPLLVTSIVLRKLREEVNLSGQLLHQVLLGSEPYLCMTSIQSYSYQTVSYPLHCSLRHLIFSRQSGLSSN